jgi:anion-transporting  ArsA/GET3 family ATPase
MADAVSFDDIIERRHIVVCCGTGGVGKTTAAAVFAVEGARRGRNAVVVTIDPAKRLANTLGLDSLSDSPREIERHRWDRVGAAPAGGRLSALMLDTKSTFDHLVVKHAADDEQAQRILANTFYRNVSTALSGTQEYMAMEKLYELHEEGGYDLIVVDTPPTRHALDFLDAPKRLARLLDNRIFRLLMMPTRAYLKAVGAGVQAFLRTVSRVVGSEVINEVVAFFRAFEGMEEGFRDRATEVLALLADPSSSFVLVTSPRRDAVEEATYFAERLAESDIPVEGLVVNRVHPSFGDERVEGLRARAETLAVKAADVPATPAVEGDGAISAERLAMLYANLADFRQVADGERHHVAGVKARAGRAAVAFVPFLARDVYDFEALGEVGRHVFRAGTDSFATT